MVVAAVGSYLPGVELTFTAIATVAGVALAGFAVLGERRARRAPLGRVSWVPWSALVFLGLTTTLFGAVHLLTLAAGG